ncbi:MAG: DUF4783 domain-containing protein [Saprospiraceae bacterium]|nr:DUF4783 domain-containing protein [Saprospiraceae bacterium]
MKGLILFLAMLFGSVSLAASQGLPEAFRSGDVDAIARHMGKSIEICHLDDVNIYSKSEATTFLTRFFGKNSPSSYEIVHEGNSRGTARYTIGKLTTSAGVYRIYVYFEDKGDQSTIRELRIDKKV